MTTEIRDKQYQIENEIKPLKDEVVILLNKIIDLRQSKILALSEKFTVEEKNFGSKKNPDFHQIKLMHYEDYFSDEDTGETITIQRTRPVEIDGKMCDEWAQPIKYYTSDDI
jgi:hypothetical protein